MQKIILILSFLILIPKNSFAQEKMGLLIIAHGSPSKQWNQAIIDLGNNTKSLLEEKKLNILEVRIAFMEFTEPSIATVIKQMEDDGITKIYALPLFIAPSGHSFYDIPTILGLYYDKKMYDTLKEEGIKIVDTNAKITLGPSLNYGKVIQEILLDKVKELSQYPKDEAVIILAHGDNEFFPFWETLSNKTGNFILGNTGIEYFDKAFVEMGQSFAVDGVRAILKASKNKKRVIVVGMYMSIDIDKMAENTGIIMMRQTFESKKMFEGKNIVFANTGLLPDRRITEWITDRAIEWLKKQ